MNNTSPVAKIVVAPVDHYTGERHTRRTWLAYLEHEDGTETKCGHEMHPTTDAATACGRKLWKATR